MRVFEFNVKLQLNSSNLKAPRIHFYLSNGPRSEHGTPRHFGRVLALSLLITALLLNFRIYFLISPTHRETTTFPCLQC